MSTMRLTLSTSEIGVCRVCCAGAIRVPDFGVGRDPLEEALGPNCFAGTLLINCEEAQSIDSSGVSWLLRCHKRLRESGGVMVLYNVPPIIENVLNLLRMDKVLHWTTTEEAAARKAEEVLV